MNSDNSDLLKCPTYNSHWFVIWKVWNAFATERDHISFGKYFQPFLNKCAIGAFVASKPLKVCEGRLQEFVMLSKSKNRN